MSIADKLATIAENTTAVYRSGYEAGTNEGYHSGVAEGEMLASVAFWDAFTNVGLRTFYEYAFRQSGFVTIQPPQVITPVDSRSLSMFHDCKQLQRIEAGYFDLSRVTASASATTAGHYNTFYGCSVLEEIEDIGLPAGGYYMSFAYCKRLHTIAVLRVNEDTKFNGAFRECDALKNITIDGTIAQDGLSFNWSPLTAESLKSVIMHLKDLTGTANEHKFTIQFSSDSWDVLDALHATAPGGVTWREYVQNVLKWNI